MPKVAVVIPSRYASTRLPAKPLHPIAGKPLVQHVWERCARAKGIDKVIVATDDMRIAEAAFSFGAEVAMTSDKHRSGTDRVAEVAKRLKGFTHIINVQGDEPLVDPKVVSKLAASMAKDRKIEMITSASIFTPEDDLTNPNMVKVVLDRESNGLYFSRSLIPYVRNDGVRPQFYRHQGIYGYTTKFLLQFVKWKPGILEQAESLEQLRALENGAKIRVVLAKDAAVSVDTPEDVTAVERILASR
ncbi:MAG TPA: 3-deoxy-manno-octulosonate cytidylyltransferase [Chthoniobacter sp.]|nr:3-deoxy-manno-octulosonate cytidylyltransferase [Chthoniobacter sp.]